MSFIEHRLGRTHFTVKGKTTDRLPVIWLHGGPGGTHNPNGNLFNLSGHRKVYAYTQLGSGKSSDLSKRQWQISTFVQELQLLVAAWGLKDFHLMGGSWGTTLALEYYLKVGGRGIRSMVLQSPMLARALYANAELDKDIPASLYTAVAQVLAYIYRLKAAMRTPVLVDGRNVWPGTEARAAGFTYYGIGRP